MLLSRRRAKELEALGLQYVDAGVSGGVWGLVSGYGLMVGGMVEAVLPFDNVSGLAADASLATGLAEGNLQRAGARLRLTVQLIDASDGMHVWSLLFNASGEDVFSVEDHVAQRVARALRHSLVNTAAASPPVGAVSQASRQADCARVRRSCANFSADSGRPTDYNPDLFRRSRGPAGCRISNGFRGGWC